MAALQVLSSPELLRLTSHFQHGVPLSLRRLLRTVGHIQLFFDTTHKSSSRRPALYYTKLPNALLTRMGGTKSDALPARALRLPNHRVSPLQLALHVSIALSQRVDVTALATYAPQCLGPDTLALAVAMDDHATVELLAPLVSDAAMAMNLAAARGSLPLLTWLHQHGASCTRAAMDGAAANGHLDIVSFLHHHRSEGCSTSALSAAVANGHIDVVRFLVAHRSEGLNRTLWFEMPAETSARVGTGHLEAVQCVVDAGWTSLAEQGLETMTRQYGLPALRLFLALGIQRVTKRTLEMAVDMRDRDLLLFVVSSLVAESHKTWNEDGTWTPPSALDDDLGVSLWELFLASWHRCVAMDIAAMHGDLMTMEMLHRLRLKSASPKALEYACCYGHLDAAKWLVAHGYDGARDNAIALAAANSHVDTVAWLHEECIQPITATAMSTAAANGHMSVVSYMLTRPLPTFTDDCVTLTTTVLSVRAQDFVMTHGFPGDAALQNGHWDIVELLQHAEPT
ncbi:hypothetical protein SDRG_09210 [Saprolegnia diclina VS20]|uniref:Uncharacterized protein n=1 Tax=Saprolegnia diclina (strain VS20) TaxID=1156394 RepID=T0QEQ0_SAPDV|nr:hypothetical protein SDRG_09210 [Saprolegnia diclina VS20]EQC33226.1 hypothetical protein SDRG_09210 [Saprolegnia diclina VS20]|eukprot:XP_008613349.1 hypothetical protein SDRG_09210 [Saprolegnia diclina VS20]